MNENTSPMITIFCSAVNLPVELMELTMLRHMVARPMPSGLSTFLSSLREILSLSDLANSQSIQSRFSLPSFLSMVALHFAAGFAGVALLALLADTFPQGQEPYIDRRGRPVNPRTADSVHGHMAVLVRLA